MKNQTSSFVYSFLLIVLLVSLCVITGCTSNDQSTKNTASLSASETTVNDLDVETTPERLADPIPTATNRYFDRQDDGPVIPPVTVSLSNGVTVTYPSDWEKEIPDESYSMRDYGRETYNIANFYSPDVLPLSKRWNQSQPNVDKSNYTVMSIDVDPVQVNDFERYFNLATLALQNKYGSIHITKHDTDEEISGYNSYRLDFDTPGGMRGTYIFTNVDNSMYILVFKNPSLFSAEIDEILDTVKIVSMKTTKKTR